MSERHLWRRHSLQIPPGLSPPKNPPAEHPMPWHPLIFERKTLHESGALWGWKTFQSRLQVSTSTPALAGSLKASRNRIKNIFQPKSLLGRRIDQRKGKYKKRLLTFSNPLLFKKKAYSNHWYFPSISDVLTCMRIIFLMFVELYQIWCYEAKIKMS